MTDPESIRVGILTVSDGVTAGREDGSGDRIEALAMAAGADGFLAKPIDSLITFQNLVLSFLPPERRVNGPRLVENNEIAPDRMAYRDDLAHIANVLGDDADERTLDYVTQFLSGLAISAEDEALETATRSFARVRARGQPFGPDISRLAGIVQKRLAAGGAI